MTTVVSQQIEEVIDKEGGYCNDKDDLGGETCWGITVAEARKFGYTGPMITLPRELAFDIYEQKYWFAVGFDKVAEVSVPVAAELFDTGINMGVGKAGEFLQMSLNALNRQGQDYADIDEDGAIGPGTIRALKAYLAKRGERGVDVLLKALNCLQGARYIDISRKRGQNESFVYGWLDNRVSL